MLNMSRLLYNKRFSQSFLVCRKVGSWDHGKFVASCLIPAPILTGVVLPASAKEILQFPEGDRSTSMMVFYSEKEILVTHINDGQGNPGTSDEIYWNGNNYKILNVNQFGDFGFYKAYGVLMEGE
ncbi:hypothetical protein REC12_11485 [Desulfosporosinus sp. PR]|uniref:hypothetical protein n=1 Tax=Candidatus Desulfosporosinus nitrosoreducens TaxID=3401928 RepID=UPI0027EEA047|nr:hypothetical protein [Desulfosporosinus sp. PR]MDQ7094211.1 hypothetical protein [Desulfosporosinus sp. PR]